MRRQIMTEAVVLDDKKYSESSKILTLFTRERGKVTVMAKGALRAKSKLVSVSQIHCHFLCNLSSGSSFYYIDPIHIINSNFGLRKNYNSLVLAGYISEMVDKSYLEGEVNTKIFDLIVKTLKLMSENKNVESLALAFSLKYISYMGYRPNLKIKDLNNIYFSNVDGGVSDNGRAILRQDVYYLEKLLYTSLDEIEEYSVKRTVFLINLLAEYIKYNLEIHEFNCLKIL